MMIHNFLQQQGIGFGTEWNGQIDTRIVPVIFPTETVDGLYSVMAPLFAPVPPPGHGRRG